MSLYPASSGFSNVECYTVNKGEQEYALQEKPAPRRVVCLAREHTTMIPASTPTQSRPAKHYTTATWHMTFDTTNLSVTIAAKLGNFLHKSDNMIDKLLLFAQHISSHCTLPATL